MPIFERKRWFRMLGKVECDVECRVLMSYVLQRVESLQVLARAMGSTRLMLVCVQPWKALDAKGCGAINSTGVPLLCLQICKVLDAKGRGFYWQGTSTISVRLVSEMTSRTEMLNR